jgi:hypothetical protein
MAPKVISNMVIYRKNMTWGGIDLQYSPLQSKPIQLSYSGQHGGRSADTVFKGKVNNLGCLQAYYKETAMLTPNILATKSQ